jgi:DNA primase
VFCFDGDEAGRKAAFRALEAALPCMTDGRQARFLFLPEGDDPDSLVRRDGADAFNERMAAARPLEQFLFEILAEDIDVATLEGRARYSRQVLPHLRQLPPGVYRELMFRELAERTGLELASLMQLEAAASKPDPAPARDRQPAPPAWESAPPHGDADAPPPSSQPAPRKRSPLRSARAGHANLTQSAIALLLHKPEIARDADPGELEELEGADAALLRDMLNLLRRRPDSSTAMLLGHWYGTAEGEVLSRLAGQERLIPSEGIEQQFRDILARLTLLPQRARLAARVDKLRSTDYAQMGQEQKQELKNLLFQLQQLDRRHRPH